MTKDMNFEEVFVLSTMALRLNRSHYSIARDTKWMIQFFLILSSSFTSLIFLLYSILFNDIKTGKIADASKNLAMVIISLTVTMKYVVLLYHQGSISELISTINVDYDLAKDFPEEEKLIVLKYAKKGVTVSKFWIVFAFGTSAIFPTKAFGLMSYNYWKGEFALVPMFDVTYPGQIEPHKNELWVFLMLFVLCLIFGAYAATMYVGFDPLVPIFMLHTCGQLELLSQRISKAFVEDVNETRQNLIIIILKLQILYNLMRRVKNYFHIFYEYNMKATTFILPLIMFQILEDFRHSRLNVEFLSFFAGCTLHFYMPCYYSDVLMEKCDKFRQALYSSGWEKQPDKQVRQIVLFMLTRAKIPMGISTVFYSINLNTFAEMCRQSYGILSLINAACVEHKNN
ncbi:odorant receptor 85c-like [Trichoplusia ni]|uniref:Odorant receptor n=1 Tax=Trichoplusia ni TaxID=7111 RepID=A0A7E5W995_TRINI|nr:odorant receptor 85c-like [Trichoplusia ni]